ncbi:hypothetical protein CMQ_7106 [Grosmannia clavigera kw1407]|uniref:Uncharacterized protein n=1 Tax=Grosmannia clavigera (strain kw1407 / UAMH 11150) TaxID=655863 RepID=F0XP99_GROCL|nr:uncharacterized protein CMQ_7106 [Grosmannia clavigera kw1407]EFX00104.1 hypothetical protein CMQ_7106 [Grosmannia clavigera kw1407]
MCTSVRELPIRTSLVLTSFASLTSPTWLASAASGTRFRITRVIPFNSTILSSRNGSRATASNTGTDA